VYLTKWDQVRDDDISCESKNHIIKQTAPGKDYEDLESSYIELKGKSVKCIGNIGFDWIERILATGNESCQNSSITGNIGPIVCGRIDTATKDQDDEEVPEATVKTFVIDDPSTSEPADHWMHPCECFSDAWGESMPVTAQTIQKVPPGCNNQYLPHEVELVAGEFICEDTSLIDMYMLSIVDLMTPAVCIYRCHTDKLCNFAWNGESAGGSQCRLFSKCATILREIGLEGHLSAVPRSKGGTKYCHMADSSSCWMITGRRSFLGAQAPTSELYSPCAWLSIAQQCDHKMLLGGFGIEACSHCEYKITNHGFQVFAHKIQTPASFLHGQTVGISCWAERFVPVPVKGVGNKMHETLACVMGKWLDSTGKAGLSNFACAACIQIVRPIYTDWVGQNMQELTLCPK